MSIDVGRDMTRVIDALSPEQTQVLDHLAEQLQGLLRTAISQGGPGAQRAKNWLNGVWLGHALHPALTDAAIGAWTTGFTLDVVGAKREADAAMTVGVLAAVPTALAGAADWVDTNEEPRRIGLLHALLNSSGLVLMIGSLLARRANQRALGFGLSTLGLTLVSVSAWLGGELVYRLGVGVTRIAFEPRVGDFVAVARMDALQEGKLMAAEVSVDGQKVSVALLKQQGSVLAFSNTCPHVGGPLAEGKLIDNDEGDLVVECPWHASRFRLIDGTACQGPAAAPVNVYDVRVRDGNVEVRSR
jgi:nitrite reductase/ring-hydroxylating ferredoxin subunit/uncharacterized membrane protein